MYDQEDVPKVSPLTIFALFTDIPAARVALEALLQGGFRGEQLGWMTQRDSVNSPANDPATYRATGLVESHSPLDQPFAADDPPTLAGAEPQRPSYGEDAIVVSVAPAEGQADQARGLLAALGGRLVREDGSLEEQAA